MTGEVLLSARGLCLKRAGREVVSDVTLELRRGEVVALLGPNGAGKSTLLDGLTGVLAPEAGEVTRSGRVAIALQAADLAHRPVLANVTLALGWWGVPKPLRADRARGALASLNAGHLAPRHASELSGGERRRVHLARAIAVGGDVLLLDEPFAGLDAETRAGLLEDAVGVLRSVERATLVVVHDRAEAWALADRLLVMIGGQLVADGSPSELLGSPPSVEVARFLGYDGELRDPSGAGATLTRPAHVSIDADGPCAARVVRAIPGEDGARLELKLERGRVFTFAPHPAPRPGDSVRVRIDGGVWFEAD
ncbi:MAG: ABC transporter ATP-binding protein [Solirubrobacteraceae bacterium]